MMHGEKLIEGVPSASQELPATNQPRPQQESQQSCNPSHPPPQIRILLTQSIRNIYVSHVGTSLKNSAFVCSMNGSQGHVVSSFHFDGYKLTNKHYFYKGDDKAVSVDQLLGPFCQTVELSRSVDGVDYLAVGTLLQHLLVSYVPETGEFNKSTMTYGIESMRVANRARQIARLGARTALQVYGTTAIHRNDGMASRGLHQYTIIGDGLATASFAFIVMVNFRDSAFIQKFVSGPCAPHHDFMHVLAGACEAFNHALSFHNDPIMQTESARLIRMIGMAKFVAMMEEEVAKPEEAETSDGDVTKENEEIEKVESTKSHNASPSGTPERVTSKPADQADAVSKDLISKMRPPLQPPVQPLNTARRHIFPAQHMLGKVTMPPLALTSVFRFDTASPQLKCRLPNCPIISTSNRPSTTICPCCGKFEYTRYCSPDHLLEDLRRHCIAECGTLAILTAIDESTIGTPLSPPRPYVKWTRTTEVKEFTRDIAERHRQAVYRSASATGMDYFIFDDLDRILLRRDELAKASPSEHKFHISRVRGTGSICATVWIPFPETRKAHFDSLMNTCLALGFAAGQLRNNECRMLYEYISEDLRRQNKWDVRMCEILCVQMGFEIGYQVPVELRLLPETEAENDRQGREILDRSNEDGEETMLVSDRMLEEAKHKQYP